MTDGACLGPGGGFALDQGDPGVGKSVILRLLADHLHYGEIPPVLRRTTTGQYSDR